MIDKTINKKNDLFDSNTKLYKLPLLENKKILVVEIGGGSNIIGAFGLSKFLKEAVKYETKYNSFFRYFDISPIVKKWEYLSSKLLNNDRTQNIMRITNNKIKNYPKLINNLQYIEKHRRPRILLKWLLAGLPFNGLILLKNI